MVRVHRLDFRSDVKCTTAKPSKLKVVKVDIQHVLIRGWIAEIVLGQKVNNKMYF